ncbi:BN860_01442g1_1 [Zygosaccharomyces bailii CLIB 213]|uniref:BN860_01442g1_1 n=1 Tax=Zygosaccharomyces bailii (strain CLIB 213 / ATCC 58445 / CBS 680 / BCRC 21525 / NBRC 1098 / NCYC 1416 / NRRL Y-2227) TaxID=1333698 RepID=A0A8J2T4E2_ZYGB2|nr:BN860_01442g1_1 [Zygosaccharomyces bailii CLIB 213]
MSQFEQFERFEKKSPTFESITVEEEDGVAETTKESSYKIYLRSLLQGAETKGVEPVKDEEKHGDSIVNSASMWFSANMVIAAFSLGTLGPLIYSLNFGQSVLVIIFFNFLGAPGVAFFSVFGAEFGLRQMILSRFVVGNLTARVFAIINIVACVGWGVVNTIVSAQMLELVDPGPHHCPPWAGCLIIVGCTLLVTFFGYRVIHLYEKYSWIPTFAVFLVIIACLKKNNSFSNGPWTGGPTTAGNVLSFGCSVFGFAAGWTTYAADYTVYLPRNTNKYKIFFSLCAGLLFPLYFCMILGAAAARGTFQNAMWNEYYTKNSVGGLTYAILVPDSLHGFGRFCCVVLALSTVANNIPNMYSIALSAQALWGPLAKVPRIIWTLLGNGATLGVSIAAYYEFEGFMQDFMDSIGYYLAIYLSISLSEHFIYRRGFKGYNIWDWDKWDHLPIGIAGCCALFCGAVGVAVGMDQTYWQGEIARKIGEYGGDIGFELGAGFAFIVYNLLRPLELKYFGR